MIKYGTWRVDASTETEREPLRSVSTQTDVNLRQTDAAQLVDAVSAQMDTCSQTDSLTAEIDDICQQLGVARGAGQTGRDEMNGKKGGGGRKGKKDRKKKNWEEEKEEELNESTGERIEGIIEGKSAWLNFPFLTDPRSIQHFQVVIH